MMFEPEAESMPPEQRAVVQLERLRALVDRLLSLDGVQAERLLRGRRGRGGRRDPGGSAPAAHDREEGFVGGVSVGHAGRPALGDGRAAWLERHRGPPDPGRAYPGRPAAVGADVRPRAGRGGRTRRSLVHNAYGYGLFTGGLGIHQGAVKLGAAVVPASGGMTARQVTLIRDLQPDILTCTPSYAIRLGEALAEAGLRPGEGLNLRAGLFGAEPWSMQLRARIEELLGLRALDIYGLSEVIGPGVASECFEAADGLHVNEDHFLVEAVDPATASRCPTAPRVSWCSPA